MRRFKVLAIISVVALIAPYMARAATPPLPEKKSEALGDFEEKLKENKESQQGLKAKAKEIEDDLNGLQKKLVSLGASIQKNEKEMGKLDASISELESEQSALQKTLESDRASMADLIMALQRVRRLPPEALLVKPDAPLKTAQSAMLLENALPGLYDKAESLKINLKKNEELSAELKDKREKVASRAQELQKEQKALATLATKREALYRSTQKNLSSKEKEAKRIATQARNLKDLVANLKKERKKQEAQELARMKQASARGFSLTHTPPPKPGSARLPISGIIKTSYNQPDHIGAPSQGLDIEGRGGALVVAPMGGTVRYAGPFKNYGKMVIIEHTDGYHSLIAGLEKGDVVVGQSVISGEPIGTLHYATSSEKPVLYYELRYNGKAVNPSVKFADLS
ncbi:MAG: peptidoglycan DD-metalloendopeptidase family protein [Micavibrio sp.]|nr:peptidoglycan DD-metalloendopeptidase family protein [Micavibrio sp.]